MKPSGRRQRRETKQPAATVSSSWRRICLLFQENTEAMNLIILPWVSIYCCNAMQQCYKHKSLRLRRSFVIGPSRNHRIHQSISWSGINNGEEVEVFYSSLGTSGERLQLETGGGGGGVSDGSIKGQRSHRSHPEVAERWRSTPEEDPVLELSAVSSGFLQ